MSVVRGRVRHGAYFDSIVLMQLQVALAALPEVEDAGAVMATEVNLELLAGNGLSPPELGPVQAEDLVVAVRAADEEAAERAPDRLDELLARRSSGEGGEDFRPRSLDQAVKLLPEARWVMVSVPGRFAAGVARQALQLGRNVFLYSDNVSLADEVSLKTEAGERGQLVMGPDCGTAVIGGAGFAFANRVRRGRVGLVAASGTGLQLVASRIHALGGGISHALGTGGRDLSKEVAGRTALAALDLLARDADTEVIVLVSKPPAPAVAARLLQAARACGKPVVVAFQGIAPPPFRLDGLSFAGSLEQAAERAVRLLHSSSDPTTLDFSAGRPPWGRRWLRGLFSGGTLAYEALLALRYLLQPLASNVCIDGVETVAGTAASRGHALLDLGADEFTVGRLHPMIDPDLRLRRLRQEAADPEVAAILLDVVLGDGAHPDPAGALAAAVAEATARDVTVAALLVGTDLDPQDLGAQRKALLEAGARVFFELPAALAELVDLVAPSEFTGRALHGERADFHPVDLAALAAPPAVLNVGLESFHLALEAQGAPCLQLDWRPPAGGDERLLGVLERLRSKSG